MADGVVLTGDWFEINGDDYDDEALVDGTQLRARLRFDDLESGSVQYWGVVEDEEDDDE